MLRCRADPVLAAPPCVEQDVVLAEDWDARLAQCLARGRPDCAICMGAVRDARPLLQRRRAVLLSCSHLFHDGCISRLELLLAADSDFGPSGAVPAPMRCPVCRCVYEKRLLALDHCNFI